jgi:hypothetical protein
MAALRSLAVGVLCRAGPVNLAAALRHHARNPARPLASLGISLGHNQALPGSPKPCGARWRTPMLVERLLSPAASQAIPVGAAWCR